MSSVSSISVSEKPKAQPTHIEDTGKPSADHIENSKDGSLPRPTDSLSNPLVGIPRKTLLKQATRFAEEYDLPVDLVQRGALVAQSPDNIENIPELTSEEREALEYERHHKWSHPLAMYLTIILCSIGACVQGWDQTGANGANLSFPVEFGIPITDETDPKYDENNWLVGLINSGPYIGAFACSVWLADPLNHWVGRRGSIMVAGIFCIIAPIGSAFCQTWWELLICRLLLGVGVGFKEVTAPIFAAENAPSEIRGALVMSWQMWTAFGIFLGYSANLVVYRIPKIAWRLEFGSAMIPAIPLVILVYLCPESPRWYIRKGNITKAWQSLLRLRKHPLQAARDVFYITTQIQLEEELAGDTSYAKRFVELFYKNRLRQATLASFVVMIAQQMCGINIIAFFSSSIFEEITHSESKSLWASWGFGLVMFVFAWPAIFTIDTYGRRTLLLFTFPQMFWTLLAAGLSYLASDEKVKLGLVALFIYLFTVFYSPGEGPVPFAYSAEVFPISHREVGMAWAVTVNNFFAAVLSLTFFRLRAAFTTTGAFGFYAGLNLVALVWIFFWVPETKQLSLEELDSVFSVPTTVFMKYQTTRAFPYFVHRWVCFNKDQTLVPFAEYAEKYNKQHHIDV